MTVLFEPAVDFCDDCRFDAYLRQYFMWLNHVSSGTIFASISCQNTTCSRWLNQVHSPKIKIQVTHMISSLPNVPPDKIVKYATPLSGWILESSQKLPSNTESRE